MIINYSKDYYKILIIPHNATQQEVEIAYKSQIKTFHPDNISGSDNLKKVYEERFKEIQEAYEILSNEGKRRNYDLYRQKQYDKKDDFIKSSDKQETNKFWEKQAKACDSLYKDNGHKIKIARTNIKSDKGNESGCLIIIIIIVIGFCFGFFFL